MRVLEPPVRLQRAAVGEQGSVEQVRAGDRAGTFQHDPGPLQGRGDVAALERQLDEGQRQLDLLRLAGRGSQEQHPRRRAEATRHRHEQGQAGAACAGLDPGDVGDRRLRGAQLALGEPGGDAGGPEPLAEDGRVHGPEQAGVLCKHEDSLPVRALRCDNHQANRVNYVMQVVSVPSDALSAPPGTPSGRGAGPGTAPRSDGQARRAAPLRRGAPPGTAAAPSATAHASAAAKASRVRGRSRGGEDDPDDRDRGGGAQAVGDGQRRRVPAVLRAAG